MSDPPWPELQDEIAHFHTLGDVVLISDFNARTGDFQTNTHQSPNSRISKDTKVNSYGLKLMSLCSAFDFKICNGSLAPDIVLGNCTCHVVNGSSCVDYAIVSQSLAQQTIAFQVDEFELETLSDHCPIAHFLSLVKNSRSSHRSSRNLAQDLSNDIISRSMTPDSNQNPESHDNIKWIEENLSTFSEALESTPPNFNYDNIMNSPDNPNNAQISIDSIVQSYTQNILQIATESGFMTSGAPSSKQKPNTPKCNHLLHWFDHECYIKKKEVRSKLVLWRRSVSNNELRAAYFKSKSEWRRLI
jgi:hypothetical protein